MKYTLILTTGILLSSCFFSNEESTSSTKLSNVNLKTVKSEIRFDSAPGDSLKFFIDTTAWYWFYEIVYIEDGVKYISEANTVFSRNYFSTNGDIVTFDRKAALEEALTRDIKLIAIVINSQYRIED